MLERIEALAGYLRDNADLAERQGQLPAETVRLIRDTGAARLLQPREWNGFEAHPCEFFDAVMAAGVCGASAWVLGVVGVHPWELAHFAPEVQALVWGHDADTWAASSYAPKGRAVAVEGGYVVDGHWSFSSGVDHCQWALLGAVVAESNLPIHVLVPRSGYEIVDGSWAAMGLQGTGSKDVVVRDLFVPAPHTIVTAELTDGRASARAAPLYHLPWSMVFPVAVTSAVVGIAQAAIATQFCALRGTNPSRALLYTLGEASADVDASRMQLYDSVKRAFDLAAAGRTVGPELQARGRRDQVRCAWRAVRAVDEVFARAGGDGIRRDRHLQRLWRDANAGLHHTIHTPSEVYETYVQNAIEEQPA